MNREKFEAVISYIEKSNRLNSTIIYIFYQLNNLLLEIEDELVHLKPTLTPENYQSHIDSLIYDLNKLDIVIPIKNMSTVLGSFPQFPLRINIVRMIVYSTFGNVV